MNVSKYVKRLDVIVFLLEKYFGGFNAPFFVE